MEKPATNQQLGKIFLKPVRERFDLYCQRLLIALPHTEEDTVGEKRIKPYAGLCWPMLAHTGCGCCGLICPPTLNKPVQPGRQNGGCEDSNKFHAPAALRTKNGWGNNADICHDQKSRKSHQQFYFDGCTCFLRQQIAPTQQFCLTIRSWNVL